MVTNMDMDWGERVRKCGLMAGEYYRLKVEGEDLIAKIVEIDYGLASGNETTVKYKYMARNGAQWDAVYEVDDGRFKNNFEKIDRETAESIILLKNI
jgi:hypothetical protein